MAVWVVGSFRAFRFRPIALILSTEEILLAEIFGVCVGQHYDGRFDFRVLLLVTSLGRQIV
jgi:hypothetical protein